MRIDIFSNILINFLSKTKDVRIIYLDCCFYTDIRFKSYEYVQIYLKYFYSNDKLSSAFFVLRTQLILHTTKVK